jgi:tetratricopeptide (TPR) repeat protein
MKVSLCMIVCNEETCLPTCLDSVRHLVDEILIVDTGSTDGSLVIADQAGARVVSMSWQGDFAQARNLSLAQAGGDWILVMDADEVLEPCTRKEFERFLLQEDIEGYFLPIRNVLEKPEVSVSTNPGALDYVVRLFRNRSYYRFEGALHEQIAPSILRVQGENALAHAPLSILHFGYLPERIKEKNKSARNRRILAQELAQNPDSPFYLYCLGIEYLQLDEAELGIPYLEQALQVLRKTSRYAGYYPDLLRSLAVGYLQRQQMPEFFSTLELALQTLEITKDYLILFGIGHLMNGEPTLAIQRINQALTDHPPESEMFSPAQIHSLLGDCYAQANLPQSGIAAYLKALESSPYYLHPLLQILMLLRSCYTPEQLFQDPDLLRPILHFAPPHLQWKMSRKLTKQNALPLAVSLNLCAFSQVLDTLSLSPDSCISPKSNLISRQDIAECLNGLGECLAQSADSSGEFAFLTLDLLVRELEIHCRLLEHYPDELAFLNHLPGLIRQLFIQIIFYCLPDSPTVNYFSQI